MFRNIRWRIAIPYLALILLVMWGLTAYLSQLVNQASLAALQRQLLAEARLLADEAQIWFAAAPPPINSPTIQHQVRQWAELLDLRVTLIAPDGTVLAESYEDPTLLDNHLYRVEVQQALQTDAGNAIRFSDTMGEEVMYAAVSIYQAQELVAVLRVGVPLRDIADQVNQLRHALLAAAILTTLFALVIALIIAERTARPIRQLTLVAGRLAAGDLDARLHNISTRDEVRDLALAFNQMGDHPNAVKFASAHYQFDLNEINVYRNLDGREFHEPLPEPEIFTVLPLLRVFTGKAIREAYQLGGGRRVPVLVPNIKNPNDNVQLLTLELNLRSAIKLESERITIADEEYLADKFNFTGGNYDQTAKFWVAENDLQLKYEWQQNDVFWEVKLTQHDMSP